MSLFDKGINTREPYLAAGQCRLQHRIRRVQDYTRMKAPGSQTDLKQQETDLASLFGALDKKGCVES